MQRHSGTSMAKSSGGHPQVPLIERAYQLADSGEFESVLHICYRLHREGYTEISLHFEGSMLRTDLRRRCDRARGIGPMLTPSKPRRMERLRERDRQKQKKKSARMKSPTAIGDRRKGETLKETIRIQLPADVGTDARRKTVWLLKLESA